MSVPDSQRLHDEGVYIHDTVCSICGRILEIASKEFDHVYKDTDLTTRVIFHTIFICPKKRGVFGFFFFRHDRRIFSDDGSDVSNL